MAELSEFRALWLMCMFDLPTLSKLDRRRHGQFRKLLLEDGFQKMQFSVYFRYCGTRDSTLRHTQTVQRGLPVKGHVRILTFTDAQFGRMICFQNLVGYAPEVPPSQLKFF